MSDRRNIAGFLSGKVGREREEGFGPELVANYLYGSSTV